jgi:CHAT domain-containing protein
LEALRQAQLALLNNPGLVERYREARGLRRKVVKPPASGRDMPPGSQSELERSSPSLWAGFVLSGDGR